MFITSWFQEMADHANFSISIKDSTHRYILVNRVFSEHTETIEKAALGNTHNKNRELLSESSANVHSMSECWQLDNETIVARLPSFHLEPSPHQSVGVKHQTYTSRFPLLDKNGDTSYLLTLSEKNNNNIDVARQKLSHDNFLHVILELNPDLSVAKYASDRHVFSAVPTTQKQDTSYEPSCDLPATHLPTQHIVTEESLQVTKHANTLQLLEREREQIARRLEIQSCLSGLVKEMEHISEYVPLLQRIAEVIIVLLGADTTYLTVVDESNEFMEVVAVAGSNLSRIGFKLKRGEGIGGMAWERGEIQAVSDYPKYMNKINGFDDFKQVCVIPIKVHGEVIGVIGVVYETYSDMFMERVIEFEEFAQQITIIVENAKLIESVRIESSRNQVLYKLSNALFVCKDIETVLEYACDIVIDHCDTKLTQLFQINSNGNIHLSAMGSTCKNHSIDSIMQPTQGSSANGTLNDLFASELIQQCLETKRFLSISRLSANTDTHQAMYSARQRHEIGASVCIPLVYDGTVWGAFVAHRDKSKPDFSDADINLFGAIANQASVAFNRQKLLSEIEYQAYHDALTGLSNRLQFEERLNIAVGKAKEEDFNVAVLFIDLDGFKIVNDNYGHAAGDALLKELSNRLIQVFHSGDVVARMGGDEFAVVLTHIETLEEVKTISVHAINVLSAEYCVDGVIVNIGASIGISIFPDDSDSAGSLLKHADFAMYQSKSIGKGCAQYYDNSMACRHQARINNEAELANAIENNELRLVFQPKVSVSSQRVLGVEALLRWESQTRGNIPPSEFIPIAEESGLIIPIGDWVLKEACKQLALWHQLGLNDLCVSVNVSAAQFSTGNYVDFVEQVLQSVKLDARYLDLEVTESVMMVDVKQSVEKLLELRALGISVSIDDFGTGFSSLRYLEDLPLDNLKIDKSFIDRLDDSNPQLSLTSTIIGIAEAFSLGTVAEGVETEEQLHKVLALGCDCIQGYYFSKPVEADDLPETIFFIERKLFQFIAAA
ncbi:EAL domain-containing protein [Granulosicoccus sp.]|nr:EAL domain-containing protein [Granulosicoccus sp.]MDB4222545.1 EAL domain-containing protein [Granulosicoccus sp.]